jgi:putative methyltransferase (TIGR04325 family)
MTVAGKLRSARNHLVRHVPVVGPWLEGHHRRRFASQKIDYNAYYGVYPDFAAALAAAPASLPKGFDHAETALIYAARTRYVLACDYPAMFWLRRLFEEGNRSVFDLGGSIGIKYYAFRAYLDYPSDLRWTVCELPSIVTAGSEWAAEHDTHRQLAFTQNHSDASGQDILFASGSIQYLDYPFRDLIAALPRPPKHILVTVLPLHRERSFFTVQNMGTLFCVYRIQAQAEFVGQLKELGYVVRDQWDQPDRQCEIPFHPEYRVDKYYGFLFSRTEA